jgi:hypothetical protein
VTAVTCGSHHKAAVTSARELYKGIVSMEAESDWASSFAVAPFGSVVFFKHLIVPRTRKGLGVEACMEKLVMATRRDRVLRRSIGRPLRHTHCSSRHTCYRLTAGAIKAKVWCGTAVLQRPQADAPHHQHYHQQQQHHHGDFRRSICLAW